MEYSFISNVNILAAMTEILQNIRTNIETIKNDLKQFVKGDLS